MMSRSAPCAVACASRISPALLPSVRSTRSGCTGTPCRSSIIAAASKLDLELAWVSLSVLARMMVVARRPAAALAGTGGPEPVTTLRDLDLS